MAIIVPGRGWCTVVGGTGALSGYGLLGPLAEDDYLRRVMVTVTGDGPTQGRFGASIGASGEATIEAFRAGTPIIQRSTSTSDGVPHIFWYTTVGAPTWFWIPVGIVGSVGARYVVFLYTMGGALVSKSMMVGLEVLRFKRGGKGEGGE